MSRAGLAESCRENRTADCSEDCTEDYTEDQAGNCTENCLCAASLNGPVGVSEHVKDEEAGEGVEEDQDRVQLPLKPALGALLLASPRPLSAQALAEAARKPVEEVETALEEFRGEYSDVIHGFSLVETGGLWHFRTAPAAGRIVQRLIPPRAKRLSRAAAETLAVIAYRQPVQRAEIEAVRGVDALPTLKTLLEARLIRIVGRADSPGHPALYGTTQTFLEKFGLRDLSELPTIRELQQLEDDPGEAEQEAHEGPGAEEDGRESEE